MDRGIPTEETLEQMRTAQPPVHYLGNAQGTAIKFERKFLNLPWRRPSVDVKLDDKSTSSREVINPQRTRDATPALENPLATPPRAEQQTLTRMRC